MPILAKMMVVWDIVKEFLAQFAKFFEILRMVLSLLKLVKSSFWMLNPNLESVLGYRKIFQPYRAKMSELLNNFEKSALNFSILLRSN